MGGQKCSEKNSDTVLNRKQDGTIPGSRRRTGEVSSEWCSKLLRTFSLSAVSLDGRWLSLGEGRRAAPQH